MPCRWDLYGGGFRICPDARPDDGLLDICIAHPPATIARALAIFLMAKSGAHTRLSQIELRRVRHLDLSFAQEPPCQVDGEPLHGSSFTVQVVPRALNVLVPPPANEGHGGKLPHSGSTLSDPDRPAANSAQEA